MMARPQIDPSVLEATVLGFHLSPEEEAELEALKPSLIKLTPTQAKAFERLAETTTNAGIQFLLLQQPVLIRRVVDSEYLDSRVVPPFLDYLMITRRGNVYQVEANAVGSLLSHETVVSNVNIFKQTLKTAMLLSTAPFSPERELENDLMYFHRALSWHSAAADIGGNAMSIETLLFILAYLSRQEDKYGLYVKLGILRTIVLEVRDIEIKAWIQENMPDYVDVPLAWVLRVYDLHQAENSAVSKGFDLFRSLS